MVKQRRVVVTGIGVVSSIGIGKDVFWNNLLEGKSGISEVTSFDTTSFRCHYGGEVKNFSPQDFIPRRKVKFLGRTSQLAVAAAILALEDSQVPVKQIRREKVGVILGTTIGERPLQELLQTWARSGLRDIDTKKIFQASVNTISNNVGIQFKTMGINYLFPTACAASNYAIGYGFDLIRNGDLNFALVGGAEAFSYYAFVGFQRLYSMAPRRCQPFDKNRKGMLLGEGAGILFLESLDSAIKRGVRIYAEVLGCGLSCDAYHPTAPDPKGMAKAMRKALEEGGISLEEVDYICAHGTGTPTNDKTECQAIKEVFGERYKEIMVSSIKSMLGHTMGAASGIEAAACCLAVKNDIVPPTINYETPDPECDIDCVPNKPRRERVDIALNNGFAFGGNNCCVVFGKYNRKRSI